MLLNCARVKAIRDQASLINLVGNQAAGLRDKAQTNQQQTKHKPTTHIHTLGTPITALPFLFHCVWRGRGEAKCFAWTGFGIKDWDLETKVNDITQGK